MKIARKIILILILSITFVMVVAGWISIRQIERELVSRSLHRLSTSLDFSMEALLEKETDNLRTSEMIVHDPAISKALSLDISIGIIPVLNKIQQIYPEYNYIMILTIEGEVFAVNSVDKNGHSVASMDLLGLSVTKHLSFVEPTGKSQTFFSPPGLDPFLGLLGIQDRISQLFVTPVVKGSTQIGWALLSYDWQSDFTILLSRLRNRLSQMGNPVVDISLFDQNGRSILNSTSSENDALSLSDKIVVEKSIPFGNTFMKLVISSDKAQLFEPIVNIAKYLTFIIGLACAILLGMLYLLINRTVLRKIETIKEGAYAFLGGNLAYRLPPMGNDELGLLASTFNKMGQSLQYASENLEQRVLERTAELKVREDRERRFFEKNSSVMIMIEPETGRIVDANQAAVRFYGYPASDLELMSIHEINILPPEQVKHLMEKASSENLNVFTFQHRIKNGEIKTVEVHSTPIEQTGKTILFSIIHDISDRKRLENSLAQKTSLLECLLNSIPDIVFFKDNNGTYLGCNEQCAAFMGRKIEDVPGLTDYDLLPKDMADCCLENDLLMIEIGLPRRNEERAIHSDGRHLLLETVKAPLKSADGMPMGILGVSRDITDRKQMEESLRKSEENLRIVADYTHDWEYWIDHNGVLVYVSPSCARITGFTTEEFINRPSLLQEIVHPEDGRMAHDHFSLSEDANFPLSHLQFRINTRSGEIRWISHFCQSVFASDGAWLGRRASNHDITYEKQMSEELMENKVKLLNSTRLESLALMAGGIAHDFNNQLMTVLGNLELALNEAPDGSKIRTRIETAIMATNRSAVLSNQMLAYTGQRYFRSDNVNIHQLIDEQSGSIRSALSRSVTLDIQTASDVPTIVADEDQVKQILINLLKNASESYGEKEGEVRLSTGVMECDKAYLAQSRMEQKADPGWFVFFDVSDKGCGMDEETQARIFDPFFSTKFWGRGLGMAETMGIVKSHNGAIILNSELGNGTTVRVLLPVPAPEQPASSTFADFEKNEATVPELIGRPKTILVVEDEDSVRQLCKELLEIFGYHTITASDGLEGVEMFKANQNRIDLVLLDLLMPRMNGIEAYAEFIKIKPDIKVLISSGFSQESLEEKIKGALPAGYLHKPYQMENLKEEIERILGA